MWDLTHSKETIKDLNQKQKERVEQNIAEPIYIPSDEEEQFQMACRLSLGDSTSSGNVGSSSKSRARSTPRTQKSRFYHSSISDEFDIDLARSQSPRQLRVDTMMNKDTTVALGKAWAKFCHANDIPGRKLNCPYFKAAIKLTQELGKDAGKGVRPPSGTQVDGVYLQFNHEELNEIMDGFKTSWKDYGVTVMCDSWTGPTMMSIINFMIYSNGRMYFHKSVNATGKIQNSDFLYDCIREVVVDDIGAENVVQLVTDNGSNYKKACKMLIQEHKHIVWQPCAAHTINLMLKDIGSLSPVDTVVSSAKKISRFFYNHNRLHAEMQEKIGGELIRPNATRFGTVFIFLQSFWDRMELFKKWMMSEEWTNSEYCIEEEYNYTYDCLTSCSWWVNLKWVLDACKPLFCVLRYADQQKNATLSGFLPKILKARQELESQFGEGTQEKHVLDKINTRITSLLDTGFMRAAGALDPEAHYKYKGYFANQAAYAKAVSKAFQKMAKPEEASRAIGQFMHFRNKRGMFASRAAEIGSSSCNAADWWEAYGGDYPELQKLAKRIVSQCMSSSGCERNWSTFALVHTKVRNRLGYEKLHKLVFVHYNLKLRLQQFEMEVIQREEEADPLGIMMDVALYDEENPIMEWLSNARSESAPILDQDEEFIREIERFEPDPQSPINTVVDEVLIDISGTRFPDEPTISKRRGDKKRKKNAKTTHIDEEDIASGDDTDIDSDGSRSPEYVESGDSSSASEKIPDDEDDNVATKNRTSNDAQAKNTKVVRPGRRSKRRLKNINALIDIDKGKGKVSH